MQHNDTDIDPHHFMVRYLPRGWWPFAALIRLDRPIGTYLAFLPALMGLNIAFVYLPQNQREIGHWFFLFVILFLGAWLMRSAGCVWNDWIDRDLDARVVRSRNRPLASKQMSGRAALVFMLGLFLLAANLLWFLPLQVLWVCIFILPLVFIYPLTKRFFDAPQLWLGLTFNAGSWVAWTAVHGFENLTPPALLYVGCIFWTLAYDTIYAMQDRDDDRKARVKSLPLLLGNSAIQGILLFYSLCFVCWGGLIVHGVFYGMDTQEFSLFSMELSSDDIAVITYIFAWLYLLFHFYVWKKGCRDHGHDKLKNYDISSGKGRVLDLAPSVSYHTLMFRQNAPFGLMVACGWLVWWL